MKDSNPVNYISNNKPIYRAEDLRIILWDIDGTLMRSTKQGAYKDYFKPAMIKVFGSAGDLSNLSVAGMTDMQIFYEALKHEGWTPEKILAKKDEILPVFQEEMSRIVARVSQPYQLLSGVREILPVIAEHPALVNVLLTGNLSVAAEYKLKYFDLWKYFENAPNFFGELSHDRRELGKKSVQTLSRFLNIELSADQFIVIGDTPNDIAAARAFGAKAIAVATGRNHSADELAEFQPDAVLENLSDTDQILRLLKTI